MKAEIKKVKFVKSYETKFGTMHMFAVDYDDKKAYYSSKDKEQKNFVEGQEAEFDEERKQGAKGEFLNVKPVKKQWGNSQYAKAIKKEQSKYSGFAVSYVKDLIVADKVPLSQWKEVSEDIFTFMVNLDQSITL
jgi:hypothetical protein